MNRPNKENYADKTYAWHGDVEYDYKTYSNDLQMYCDELEDALHHSYQGHLLEVVIPSLENRIKTLEKQLVYTENKLLDTEKALDNVCEQLENICSTETYCVSHCPLGKKGGCEYRCEKKEEWKKWSINNEN